MAIMQYTHIDTSSFSPLDYTPIAWYDSSDIATITKDITNNVSQWNDKSGNGYNLTSPGGNQPLYSVNGITFNGSTQYLAKSFGINYNIPLTVYLVWDITGSGNVQAAFDNYNTSGLQNTLGWGNGYGIALVGDAIAYYPKSKPFNTLVSTGIFNGASSKIYENNVNQTLTSSNCGNILLNGVTLGKMGTVYGNYYGGTIKEVIVYNSLHTDDKITAINNYLNTKYIIY
jgi:hypothetical protein